MKEKYLSLTEAEAANRLSEQKLDITLSSIGDAVISTDNKGRISYMNPVAESLTGWTLKEAYNRPASQVFNIINEETRNIVQSPIDKVIETGVVVGLANHTLLIRKDGREVPIDDSGAPIRDHKGDIYGVVLVFRDITERKEAERNLLKSQARLKTAQAMAHLGNWELDLRTNTLNWSDEIFRIFGFKPQEFEATYEAFLEAVHPEDRRLVDNAYSGSLKEGRSAYEIEHRIIRKKTGEVRYVHEKCHHIKDSLGNVIISTGMVHDITERKIAELSLKESEQRVRKKLESILHPEGNFDDFELKDILNSGEIQVMMEHLYELTSIPMAIIDDKGSVLVEAGWQKICTRFHRVHPVTCKNCLESDLQLTTGIPKGEFKLYKCANGMWDIATPLIIGGKHKGNLFMGQFFFDDEEINVELFRKKAAFYGFKETEYLDALKSVYRISRSKLESAKGFYLKFAEKITRLSYSNLKLARSIGERDLIHQKLLHHNQRLDILSETAGRLLASPNPQQIIDELCLKVMHFLDCDIFVNYILDQKSGKLCLNACGGIDEQNKASIKWLKLGVAVCGCVARDGERIIAENIQENEDPRTELVKSFGVQAYCCHPMAGQGHITGTLSFGTKRKKKFSGEEVSMMKMVADFAAIAITRIKNEEALHESEKRANERAEELQKMMDIVPSAIWISQDPQCLQITGNATANNFYEAHEGENVSAGAREVNVRRFFRNGIELNPDELTMQVAASTGKDVHNSELDVLLPSGRWMTMIGNASPLKDENGLVRGCIGSFIDISERKKAEKESKMMIDLLQISNESHNAREFIHSSLEFFRRFSDFDAVGLRLREGDDYPYYETIGFSKEFVRSENFLCAHDSEGNIILDNHSKPLLSCLCGQVIRGRFTGENTYSTDYGSICSNDTWELNGSDENKKNCRIRNHCNQVGFQSVSLIPLKLGNENIGLLQLNDRKKEAITQDKIDLIERLAGPFTIALARFLAEDELFQKEKNLRQHAEMLEHAPVLVRNMQDEVTIWNSGMEKLYGYPYEEVLGRDIKKLLKTEFPKPFNLIMDELLEKNQWEGELKHYCKDGSIREVLSLWVLHKGQQGDPIAIIEVDNDITNRKKKEQELQQLNRVLNALQKSSQKMMYSSDEAQYIREVCKILVEDCGHSLVWVGFTEDDEFKSIRPVASYGADEEYLKNFRVSWGENEFGMGPGGKSVRSCEPVICKNISDDLNFETWRKSALQRGFNSTISLPLVSEGKAFGNLSIYSKEIDAFLPNEVNLLSNLANDLSFGITTIRLRESENQALEQLTESEEKYRTLFNEMTEGFAYLELITDPMGNPRDYRFLNVNPSFEKHTGLSAEEVMGKTASEIYPTVNNYWMGIYGDVALNGKSREFEVYNSALNRFFRVSAFSDKKGYFATIFENVTEKVIAEKELQSTKNYLESLINNANAPIIVWNPDLEIQLFNQAFEHLTGYRSEDVVGEKMELLFPAELRDEISQKIEEAQYKKLESIEIPILTKGKEVRTILWNSANIYDSDSNVLISVIAQGNDITERKKAENELRQSEQKFSTMFQSIPIGISVATIPDGKLYDINRSWLDMHGISRKEEVLGKTSVEVGLVDDQFFRQQVIQNFETYGKIRNLLMTINKNNSTRYISVDIDKVVIKDQQYMLSSHEDVTERIKAEEAIRKTQEKLNMALDNGNIGTWEKDLKTGSLIWDKRMEKMFGFAEGTFDGKYSTFENCLVEEDISYVQEAARRTIEDNEPYEIVYRIKAPDGNINFINAKASIIRNKKGKVIGLTGVCFDVTDMKKGAERVLIKLNEDLHRSNKELEQFAYVASHDLQEPLRMVSSFTQLLAKRYKDKLDQDGKEFIHFAVDGAVRMQRLINDLLNFSRIGTRGQKFARVDFNEVIQKSLMNLKLRIEEKQADISYDLLPEIKCDEMQMIQLMQNLIGNALKFCNVKPHIQIAVKEIDNYYQFSIKDNGIGIEEQYFDKIFLIFQRLLPKDHYEGTGIGLAICKRIIERHGGKIWVNSTPGKGTTFYFTLLKI